MRMVKWKVIEVNDYCVCLMLSMDGNHLFISGCLLLIPYAPLFLLPVGRFQAVGPFLFLSGSTWILIVVHILPIIFGSHGAILLCCFSPLVLVYLDSAVSQLIQGSFAGFRRSGEVHCFC